MTTFSLTRMDASAETSNTGMRIIDILTDGTNYPVITAAMTTIQAAVDAVCDGSAHHEAIGTSSTRLTNIVPTDDSRRESKWLVTFEDDVTFALENFSLPCADWTNVNRAGTTDFWDLVNKTAQMTALVAAVETNVISALGNGVTVISIEDVGRNT